MFAAVQEITCNAITAFTTGDLELAYRIEPLEELIDSLCDEMKLHHVDRLQRGICQLTQGFVFNDLLTNYERVADHCSNLAVAMIELESDSFDTHEYLISLKKVRSHSFDQYYEDYRKKFSLRGVRPLALLPLPWYHPGRRYLGKEKPFYGYPPFTKDPGSRRFTVQWFPTAQAAKEALVARLPAKPSAWAAA